MHNYLGYLPDGLEPRSRFAQPSALLPSGLIDELNAGHQVGVWWVQPFEVVTQYRVLGRTVIGRMDVTRFGNVESLVMHPDLSASFGCVSTIGKQVVADLREFDLSASRLCRLLDDEHQILAHSVMAAAPLRIGKAISPKPFDVVASPDQSLLRHARRIFETALRKSVNDPSFFDKEDTRGIISGVGLHVLSLLKADGHDEPSALAVVLEIDPVLAGAYPMLVVRPSVGASRAVGLPISDISGTGTTNKGGHADISDFDDDESTVYELITPESLNARTFSEPTHHSNSAGATQRAEDVHQQMLKKIFECICDNSIYECRYNLFADLVLIRKGHSQPDHILEIKSITTDNLEAQISKGIIQLGRRQHAHRHQSVRYHLVVEMTSRSLPAYLASIARRMDIEIHLFNNAVDRQEACHTLFHAVVN